jgi:hypothetical protein
MFRIQYVLIFLFVFQFSLSQETGFDFYRDLTNGATFQYNPEVTVKNSEVEGSFFMNDEFIKGVVYDSYKDTKTELYLRYDVFNDIFEIQLNKNESSIKKLKRSTNFEYILGDEKFVLIQAPSVINKEHYVSGNGYVSEIKKFTDKDVALYKRYIKKYSPPVKAETMYDRDKPGILRNRSYYILKNDNTYKEIDLKKRKVLDAFPKAYQRKLKKFMKSNKLKFRGSDDEEEKQAIKLVKYFSEIKDK